MIASADCVVLPSYYREGVPRVLLEAAAMARAGDRDRRGRGAAKRSRTASPACCASPRSVEIAGRRDRAQMADLSRTSAGDGQAARRKMDASSARTSFIARISMPWQRPASAQVRGSMFKSRPTQVTGPVRRRAAVAPMWSATSTAGSTCSSSCSRRSTRLRASPGAQEPARVRRRPHRPRARLRAGDRAAAHLSARRRPDGVPARQPRGGAAADPRRRSATDRQMALVRRRGMPAELWRRPEAACGTATTRQALAVVRERDSDGACRSSSKASPTPAASAITCSSTPESARGRARPAKPDRPALDPRAVPARRHRPRLRRRPRPHDQRRVEERPNRIGIDTGAYRSGVLTALAIEDASAGASIRGCVDAGQAQRIDLADFARLGVHEPEEAA